MNIKIQRYMNNMFVIGLFRKRKYLIMFELSYLGRNIVDVELCNDFKDLFDHGTIQIQKEKRMRKNTKEIWNSLYLV